MSFFVWMSVCKQDKSKCCGESSTIDCLQDRVATRVNGLLCRWPSFNEWEMYITAQAPPPRLRNDLYSVEWDVKLYYTIPNCGSASKSHDSFSALTLLVG